MQTIDLEHRLHVAVGLLRQGDQYFIQQRIKGAICESLWEFPGGKVEPGEQAEQALARELDEELGVQVTVARLLMYLPYDYDHANVFLEIFEVDKYVGELKAQEGQEWQFMSLNQIGKLPVLEAVHPILARLNNQTLVTR